MVIKRLKNGSFFVFSADENKREKRKYPPKKKKKESMNRIKGIIINIWTHFEAEEEEKKRN